jgi:hypothetical protein
VSAPAVWTCTECGRGPWYCSCPTVVLWHDIDPLDAETIGDPDDLAALFDPESWTDDDRPCCDGFENKWNPASWCSCRV